MHLATETTVGPSRKKEDRILYQRPDHAKVPDRGTGGGGLGADVVFSLRACKLALPNGTERALIQFVVNAKLSVSNPIEKLDSLRIKVGLIIYSNDTGAWLTLLLLHPQ